MALRVLLSAAGVLAAFQASAETPWPAQARGRYLPRPAWILVVPARRAPDGSLSIWDREDPWTKAWRVPRTISGLRVVTLFGDSEDRRAITAKAIDGMIIDSLEIVRRKYGAPAIGLAVSDGDRAEVAGWVRGYPASWSPVAVGANEADTRERMVASLAGMLGAKGARPVAEPPPDVDAAGRLDGPVPAAEAEAAAADARGAPDAAAKAESREPSGAEPKEAAPLNLVPGPKATVTAYRPRDDGGTDYRVTAEAQDGGSPIAALRKIGPEAAITVLDDARGVAHVQVETTMDRPAFDAALKGAGFSLR